MEIGTMLIKREIYCACGSTYCEDFNEYKHTLVAHACTPSRGFPKKNCVPTANILGIFGEKGKILRYSELVRPSPVAVDREISDGTWTIGMPI